jgi:probable F420-dependent oxidoreductase
MEVSMAMRVGVFYFPTEYGIEIGELARALEERGFESLFACEHTHIPTSRRSPFPGGGELPKRYAHTHDPFVALSFAAAATRRLLLGTGVCLVPQRDPIITAKSVASLDLLSGGRFVFGIGGGWNVEEMENHGARYATRFKLLRERVLAMKVLWTQEEAEFHGEMVGFDPVWCYPKPAQRPHPPILLGGETDHTLKRVVEFCDGWFPRAGAGFDPKEAVGRLARMAKAAGRDPANLPITVFRAPADAAKLSAYRDAGIHRVLLEVPDLSRDEILRVLDRNAPLVTAS